ncbi:MAG TPA: class I SAM-dependent methyltransferase [Minicystis sp.]|nr:class I SAM-dependent methyltransferase [Minicystis sp.]
MIATSLSHAQGTVDVEPLAAGRSKVTVHAKPGVYVSRASIETTYPTELVAEILAVKGPGYVCDEIARHEDPGYVRKLLEHDVGCYFADAAFVGARVLDFGCGCGASTMILGDLYPAAEIVGVELLAEHLRVAEARKRLLRRDRVRFVQSPSGAEVGVAEGAFDFVVMSAVYEHLLPDERRAVMGALWRALRPGGCLFLNQTPHRLFPIETHTTGLPLLNYLPDAWAHRAACRLSPRIERDESWETLLRKGIRGATDRELLDVLGADAHPLEPSERGCRDRLDLWYTGLGPRHAFVKRALRDAFKVVRRATGVALVPSLAVAFEKSATA